MQKKLSSDWRHVSATSVHCLCPAGAPSSDYSPPNRHGQKTGDGCGCVPFRGKAGSPSTVHAASALPHHLSGTIYHDISKTMTLVVNNLLAIWRQFCFHGPICQRRLWERLFKRRFINGLTYLLTMSPGQRPTSVPSGILIHPAVWTL